MRNMNVSYSSFDNHVCMIHVLAYSSSLTISTKWIARESIFFIRRSSPKDSIKGEDSLRRKNRSIDRSKDRKNHRFVVNTFILSRNFIQHVPKSIGIVLLCVLPRCHVGIKTEEKEKKKEKKTFLYDRSQRRNAFETSTIFLTY